jgi:cytochrome o ubiquinol oxidase subunit 1
MVISIPTGAKIFNWLFTMYRGSIRFELPMMWVVAFMLTFVVGGMTGVLLAVPPADFVLHNSLFLVAHFHNVIIGGVVFGLFAGIEYWFPKAFGFKLDKFWGKVHFWGWVIGYWVAWTPIYIVGLMGTTRRVRYLEDESLQPYFVIAAIGAVIILIGIVGFLIGLVVSIRKREELRDHTGDPWEGRTLEWSTSSPPPAYNYAFTPRVHDLDAWYDMKSRGYQRPLEGFKPIHMPKPTATGIIQSGLALVLGFAMVWYMWWLAVLAFAGLVVVTIAHTFNYDRDYYIPTEEVERIERARGGPSLEPHKGHNPDPEPTGPFAAAGA